MREKDTEEVEEEVCLKGKEMPGEGEVLMDTW